KVLKSARLAFAKGLVVPGVVVHDSERTVEGCFLLIDLLQVIGQPGGVVRVLVELLSRLRGLLEDVGIKSIRVRIAELFRESVFLRLLLFRGSAKKGTVVPEREPRGAGLLCGIRVVRCGGSSRRRIGSGRGSWLRC